MLRADLLSVVPENAVRFLGHDTHVHEEPHLIHVVSGTADLVVEGRAIRLGPRENLWLAPRVAHSAKYSEESVVFGPFLSPHTIPPARIQLLGIVPDLSRIVATILGAGPRTSAEVHRFRVALDEVLNAMRQDCFSLVSPRHPAARQVARASLAGVAGAEGAGSGSGAAPGSSWTGNMATLEELAASAGTSARHIQRLFREETGLSFRSWRARARLNVAVAQLRGGAPLQAAARAAGYTTRPGLLTALSRETGIARDDLARDPVGALDRWIAVSAPTWNEGCGSHRAAS